MVKLQVGRKGTVTEIVELTGALAKYNGIVLRKGGHIPLGDGQHLVSFVWQNNENVQIQLAEKYLKGTAQ
jgi:hypothetical protein